MRTNFNITVVIKGFLSLFLLSVFLPHLHSQQAHTKKRYKASVFTTPSEFTSGIEGPAVDKNGILYAVNYDHQGTIGQVNAAGESSLFVDLPEGSIGNGIRFDSEGIMYIADYKKHNILKVDMDSKKVSIYAHNSDMNQPNDLAIDGKNRIYASDPNWKEGTGKLWRIDPDGSTHLIMDNMGTTNGIEVSPDDKSLFVNETVQRKVWAFDLSADGEISNKRLLIEFPDFGMDGMRCDIKGNLYISRHGKGTVVKVSPKGKILKEIELTGKKPSNVAFGGVDGCTVYVTLHDNGNIESFRVPAAGRSWMMNNQRKN